ncbi:Peptidase S49 [Cynara cardunculus var. scolymus]|uniref:Peptidase S49 n=1 Tax=Cynara cardunculus var. scolymus TaxID=59895 RepID=A0A124SE85_CYNCS|nr:Peptidase S49 [Cynara cardunculus var. scolymus]
MSRFLATTVHISAAILTKSRPQLHLSSPIFFPPHFTSVTYYCRPKLHRSISVRAVDSSSDTKSDDVLSENQEDKSEFKSEFDNNGSLRGDGDYPSGEFEFESPGAWKSFVVKLRMLIAYPWQRVRKGSVLEMKLRGQISDQVKTRFSSGLSLPQICENLIKAAYDPRISGVYLHIETLNCGWGKIEEIRRHILDFRKSGKFIIGYAPTWSEKEYYLGCACEELYAPPSAYFSLYGLSAQASFLGGVLEKVGVQPQVQRIGKYKSAGDQLMRKNISEENREVLTTLVDNIYGNWVDKISQAKGKKKEDIESFINDGVYQVEKLKEDGWITDIKYDDEVTSMLKTKLGIVEEKKLPVVDYKKYSRVRKWTLGLSGGRDRIAVIRASGSISRVRGPFSSPSSGIIAEQFIEKIRTVRESKRYKAVIIRIDSPGGDALASDLMWREIRLLAASKPVIASMVDVAASGGYYMAMAAQTILSENLTLTGKFNLGKLYERIGFNKEIISKGRYAELTAADQRPFSTRVIMLQVDKMEEIAQGRVWTGNDAASRGLVDAIGGFSRAVTLVELSKSSPSLPEILSGIGSSVIGIDTTLKQLLDGLTSSDGVQARMDGIMFQRSEGSSFANPIFDVLKDYLSSL